MRACMCVTYGDTLVSRDMYNLFVAYIYGIKSHASNSTPVYKDIHCSVATGLIYVVLIIIVATAIICYHVHEFFKCTFAYSHRCDYK